ncbi:FtsX-like permease family protein [Streptomyces sp. NPDC000134]|uniref:FtsX-like permease family protein n=1 Tax=Streptomyces sp. NPDC000134 TaxID=3364536 RepID=UPI0036BA2006
MTGPGGLTAFVLARARAHRPLLAAALLTVLLTTAVLATLTAYAGAIGDAALRHSLRDPGTAADTALLVEADVPAARRGAAARTVREGARRTFDGLPVTVRTLTRSGPYALPATGDRRSAGAGAGAGTGTGAEAGADPDLTHFAALDPGQVRFVAGRPPRDRAGTVEAALPVTAAGRLGLRPGARLTLTDRLDGPPVRVEITGLYRPADATAPYWRLDDLGGRGVRKGDFTTYGPLLAAPGTLTGARVSAGPSGWLATADFSTLTADRTEALRAAAREGTVWLRGRPVLSGTTAARTSLPEVLDRLDRSLLVARSTLLVIALQLALLAGCALLLVARLLSAERAGELKLLRARGASRARLAGLAALEALLLAVPAALCAPLLAGPLTRLLAGQGPLARIGLRPQVPFAGDGSVRWVALAAALGCALAVTLPALASSPSAGGRARPLPAPLRAGADLALLAVAGVAYWQLAGQTSGAVTADTSGGLGVDPLLVAAPALALLAGTVLTLRLLPPMARLAERRATGGRGLTAALALWQLSRRPARAAGPVLLLVLAVALGTLAIGQGASWDRSQDDQADFRAGAPVRVLGTGAAGPGRTEALAAVPGVRRAAPAARAELPLSGNRTATVLALDTARAADTMLLRRDLAARSGAALLSGLTPHDPAPGAAVPAGATRLDLTASLRSDAGPGTTADVTVTVEDRYGVPYPLWAGDLPADGRPHTLAVTVAGGPLTVTGVELVMVQPIGRAERHRLTVTRLTATTADGTVRGLPLPRAWTAVSHGDGQVSAPDARTGPTPARLRSAAPPTVEYGTGYTPADETWASASLTVRLRVARPAPPPVTAVATDRFLASAGARTGQRVDVAFGGTTVPVRITRAVRELPSTTRDSSATGDGGALLVDLRAVNRALQARYGANLAPTEWWLATAPGAAREAAAALRAFPDLDPAQVVVRDELARRLRDDPFGAGPGAVFTAAAGVAAALAAVGFAVSATGSLRERGREFAILRALGAPRRGPARTVAVEQGFLIGLALLVGAALGVLLTRAVVPLIVLTPGAARPVPEVLVLLPGTRVAALLAAVALVPALVTAALAARHGEPASALRDQGGDTP